jgi:chorismate dehydratase
VELHLPKMSAIKVGIVNYLNTKPLLFGLEQLERKGIIELVKKYPSAIADDLKAGMVDIALIPIAEYPNIPNGKIIGTHCISSRETVASVCLFSHVPIEEIETILLDYQSRTSVQLIQILCKEYWKKEIEFLPATENYISKIEDTTAALIIGDRAFEQLHNFEYVYDLAEAWHTYTTLPFVFALWISNTTLSEEFIEAFEQANEEGMQYLDTIAKEQHYTFYDLKDYYTNRICYNIDADRNKSKDLFLQKLSQKKSN